VHCKPLQQPAPPSGAQAPLSSAQAGLAAQRPERQLPQQGSVGLHAWPLATQAEDGGLGDGPQMPPPSAGRQTFGVWQLAIVVQGPPGGLGPQLTAVTQVPASGPEIAQPSPSQQL